MEEKALTQWKKLLALARQLKETAPWQWMSDLIFGVEEPRSGEVAYCSVIGQMDEVYGLVVYPGNQGLSSYLLVLTSEGEADELTSLEQRCLTLFFADRDELTKRDRDLIKEAGFRFRGKNAWPLFRSSYPGCHPWYLTDEEARFLQVVLEQSIQFCLAVRQGDSSFDSPEKEGSILVRFLKNNRWRQEWRQLVQPPEEEITIHTPTDLAAQKLKQKFRRSNEIWETGFFYAPEPISEKNRRPYYPLIILWLDRRTNRIIHFQMFRRGEWNKIPESLIDAITASGRRPAAIDTEQKELMVMLEPAADKLEIKLERAENLSVFPPAKNSLYHSMQRRK